MEVPSSRGSGVREPDNSRPPTANVLTTDTSAPRRNENSGVQRIPPNGFVVAQSGESVYGLSRQYGVPMRAIIEANNLSAPFHLRIGQRVTLPVGRIHTVSSGENLHTIAQRYGAEPYALARVNGIGDGDTLYVGQSLHIPDRIQPATAPAVARTGGQKPSSSVRVSELPAVPPPRSASGSAVSKVAPSGPIPTVKAAPAVGASAPTVSSVPRAAAAVPAPPPMSGSGFIWPVRGKIITKFGTQSKGLHNDGLNIAAPRGAEVLAAESGVIAYAGNELRGFGNLLLVKHDGGWVTAYAHNGALLVKRGDKVTRGQIIARVGSSGGVSEPQLHFELRRGPNAVDPLGHLKAPLG